jgi:hypothetical protein
MIPFLVELNGRLDYGSDLNKAFISFAIIGMSLSVIIYVAGFINKLNHSLAV